MALLSFCILGVHSFADAHRKTGIQHIAQGLGEAGHDVSYVSVPTSVFDLVGAARRSRLARGLKGVGGRPVCRPGRGVAEYTFTSLVPIHRLFLFSSAADRLVTWPMPWGRSARSFDVCIHDVGPCMIYAPHIPAARYVLRLNDDPHGFADMPTHLVRALRGRMREGFYHQVWAVSEPLAEYARELVDAATQVRCIPNGVSGRLLDCASATQGEEAARRAVYVGPNVPWLDLELLCATARLLPRWSFDVYGDGYPAVAPQPNVLYRGPVPHGDVPAVLGRYKVGVLPYRDERGRMRYVHRPLKFYEYHAAGLGIACSGVGGLKAGIGSLAQYGSGPEEFAGAVRRAAASIPLSLEERVRFVDENSWGRRLESMLRALGDG